MPKPDNYFYSTIRRTHYLDTAQVEPFARLRTLIADDPVAVDAYFATLSGADVVRAMFRLDEDERQAILSALAPEIAAEFIEDVPDDVAADLIEALPVQDAASIVTALPSHERADVLAEVEEEDRHRILGALAPETAADARALRCPRRRLLWRSRSRRAVWRRTTGPGRPLIPLPRTSCRRGMLPPIAILDCRRR